MKMKTIVATAAGIVVIASITAWLAGFSHQPTATPAPAPQDTGPVQLNNSQFKPDGNRDGTFVVEVDPDTRRTSNSAPAIHIKGPFVSDTSDTVFNAVDANGNYKKTDNSSSTRYIVSDSSSLYGKRVRVSFWLKTRDVSGWVGTFVIITSIDGGTRYQYDDMSDRPVRGTTDWQQYESVTDLPNKPCIIYLGPDLYGPGEMWADDFQVDLAPNEPVTDDTIWRIADESDPTLYSVDPDSDVTHGGHPALCFAYTPKGDAPRGVHTRLAHDFYGPDVDKYSGHTMRMSGWIKTENVSGRIEPTISPLSGWHNALAKDSMYRDYSLKGTRDWTQFSVTCAIPDNTEHISTGFVFSGSGKAWIDMDSIKYEIVK